MEEIFLTSLEFAFIVRNRFFRFFNFRRLAFAVAYIKEKILCQKVKRFSLQIPLFKGNPRSGLASMSGLGLITRMSGSGLITRKYV